jgi:hypothetical protein
VTDLSLIDTDALVAELCARFDAVCFVGEKDVSGAKGEIHRYWHGPVSRIVGMLELAKRNMVAKEDLGASE